MSWQGREVISLFINPRLLSFTLTAGMTPAVGPTWWVVPFQPQSEVTCIKSTYIPYIKWSNWYRTDSVMMNNTKVVIGAFIKVCWTGLYSLESRQKRSNRWNLCLFHCWFSAELRLTSCTQPAKICLSRWRHIPILFFKTSIKHPKLLKHWCQCKVESLIAFSSFCLQMACMRCLSPLAPWPWLACWQSSLTRWVGT